MYDLLLTLAHRGSCKSFVGNKAICLESDKVVIGVDHFAITESDFPKPQPWNINQAWSFNLSCVFTALYDSCAFFSPSCFLLPSFAFWLAISNSLVRPFTSYLLPSLPANSLVLCIYFLLLPFPVAYCLLSLLPVPSFLLPCHFLCYTPVDPFTSCSLPLYVLGHAHRSSSFRFNLLGSPFMFLSTILLHPF